MGIDSSVYDVPAGSLSYGDRRTLEVAMALSCDPVVLCLDEPTAGMGIGESENLATLVGRLGQRLAVVLVEHRMSMVHQVSDDVTVLAFGSVIAQGSPKEVAANERVQEVYLGREGGESAKVSLEAPPTDFPPSEPTGNANIVLRDVNSFYGASQALHDVSLEAKEGFVTSILGRNGAGKTTTMATIMGLVQAKSGTIRMGDEDLTKLSTHKIAERGITLIPEHRWIFPDLTVEENIQLAGGNTQDLLDEAYTEFPVLAERRRSKGSQLSGGQQQMLAFARAIVRHPSVVLLDEPTQGLAPIYVEGILKYILHLRVRGITVILVEQVLDIVTAVSDTVYLMADGKIMAQLDPNDLDESNEMLAKHLLVEHH